MRLGGELLSEVNLLSDGQGGSAGPGAVLQRLHDQCADAIASSLKVGNETRLGESYVFAHDLETWCPRISDHSETDLLSTASAEYVLAMLNVCQGQYRNAFKGLRLVLELCLQFTYLSASVLLREEGMKGEQDTIWATLVAHEQVPFGIHFCRAFFPELKEHTAHFRALAQTVYRELSECIHGNVPNHIPLPASLEFS